MLAKVGPVPTLLCTANDNFFSRLRQVPMNVSPGQFGAERADGFSESGQADGTLDYTCPGAVKQQL